MPVVNELRFLYVLQKQACIITIQNRRTRSI